MKQDENGEAYLLKGLVVLFIVRHFEEKEERLGSDQEVYGKGGEGKERKVCKSRLCSKSVYAAEQVMGPGRKLYHKPCLACTSCNKRLDSYTLLEHDQQPYCKSCHVKNFGTRDLRQANLPQAPRRSSSTSPPPPAIRSPTGITFSLQPNRSLSPTKQLSAEGNDPEAEEAQDTVQDDFPSPRRLSFESPASPQRITTNTRVPVTLGRSSSAIPASMVDAMNKPLTQTATGTRYGAALGGISTNMTGSSPRKWGGGTPSCPKCEKSVYFAEQVKAIGKTWHKNCLRCKECNTLLDSTRLRDHQDTPFCGRCYNKRLPEERAHDWEVLWLNDMTLPGITTSFGDYSPSDFPDVPPPNFPGRDPREGRTQSKQEFDPQTG
ncbi:hypothetical protein V5O48_004810 [Marasmius crinis-equi]|uniref:LIM zinc-binding domain-containing protein n=1 Tax=Marasmius crinis-equi TaxID=585013 RepID=A0ABR3FP01_9AGAR